MRYLGGNPADLTRPVDVSVLALGAAVGVVVIAAIWKMSGLRAELVSRWQERIDLVRAGLDEHASHHLMALHAMITEALPIEEPFDPTKVIRNPALMQGSMRAFFKILDVRGRLSKDYARILVTGPALFWTLLLFLASFTAFICYFSALDDLRSLGYVGLALCVLALLVSGAAFGNYYVRQQRLTEAEILSSEAVR